MPRKKSKTTLKVEETRSEQRAAPEAAPLERMKMIPLIAHCKAMLEVQAGRVVDAIVARRRAFGASEAYCTRMKSFARFAPCAYYKTPSHKVAESQYNSFLDSHEGWELGRKLTLQAAESQVVLRGVAMAFVQAYGEAGARLGKLVAYKILRLLDTEARSSGAFDPPEWPEFLSWIEVLGVDLIFIKKELSKGESA